MLAVALNYKGAEVEKNLGSILMELFDGFKMIKIYPGDDLKKDQLQLCQSEGYKDLMAYIQENGDPSNSMLELWGPRSKLQKAVRYKFYFDQEKKIENVYLDKRKNIEKMLQQKQPELLISCKQARRMARELGVSMFLVGSVCDELGYKITRCGLGCF